MLYQMQWWDKLDVICNFSWLVLLGLFVVVAIVIGYREYKMADDKETASDECHVDCEECQADYEREIENMRVERIGWKSINEDLREENEELKRKNSGLILENHALRLQMDKLVQSYKVVTLDDLQKGLESYHTRMSDYISEQDQVLAAYTTGNFFVKNTENLQNKLEALASAEDCIQKAKNYISVAIAACSKE